MTAEQWPSDASSTRHEGARMKASRTRKSNLKQASDILVR